ncbi:MAG TPA: nucleotide exchange factor GrpE [Caulobacteraceae bacterium]|jgi:molecular chaperone GrpE
MTDETTPAQTDGSGATAEELGSAASVEQLQAEIAEWRDKAMRAAAEAENTRRRAEREMNDARAFAIQRFARELFAAADNLERALAAAPREDEDAAVKGFVTGIEMTEKALQGAFERNGLKKIAPEKGGKFDPHLHQAMMEQPSEDAPPGSVIQVMQTGYELFGRVLRPAMVIVAAKGAPSQPQAANDQSGGGYATGDGAAAAGASVDTKA